MRRPVLAPGLRVLQRTREELQVGLGADVRLRLPATEPVRRTLGHLLRGETVPDDDPEAQATLDLLAPALLDGSGLVDADIAPGDVAAVALRDPAAYPSRLAARRQATVAVTGTLGSPGADPRPLLGAAGVCVVEAPGRADVVLRVCTGELDRADLDPLLRAGIPHLVVRLVEGSALVGPFVEPGRTACLRCIDAHRALDEPDAAVLATRHALAGADRQDGVAEPLDSALAALAIAWAVRDLVTHVEGDRPSTWSAVVRLSPVLESVSQTEWLRHPACGCSWLPDEQPSRTMAV